MKRVQLCVERDDGISIVVRLPKGRAPALMPVIQGEPWHRHNGRDYTSSVHDLAGGVQLMHLVWKGLSA